MPLLTDRCADKIRGVLSCWDRVVVMGTIPDICYADAMARHLAKRGVRLFDFPKYAEPLRDEIRENAERIAREAGLKIDHNRRKDFRKEERIKEIVAQRGDLSGCSSISTDTTGSPPSSAGTGLPTGWSTMLLSTSRISPRPRELSIDSRSRRFTGAWTGTHRCTVR